MTSDRLLALQADLATANTQIAEWTATKLRLQGQIDECAITVGGMTLAAAFTGWLPEVRDA